MAEPPKTKTNPPAPSTTPPVAPADHKTMHVIETYTIQNEGISVDVNIIDKPEIFSREYYLNMPQFGAGTRALMNNLKNVLLGEIGLGAEKMMDAKQVGRIKERFKERAKSALGNEFKGLAEESQNYLISFLIQDMLGLGRIDLLLSDNYLEEIVVNHHKEPVWVYHKKYSWLRTNVFLNTEEEIENYASIIARRVGKQITTLAPLLDAHLLTGDRANATLFPISSLGNTLTIRRFRRDPWTVTDFIKVKTVNAEMMSFIWLGMQYELNMILSGGTGSGKTSFMNVVLPFIQPTQRVLTIEDSVAAETEIIYQKDGRAAKSTVGELIDGLVEDDSIHDVSIENDEGIRIASMTAHGQMEWREPSRFIRHHVQKDLLKITLKSGRTIEVTPDHSLFTLSEKGKIEAISGKDLKSSSWLATPRMMDWPGQKIVFDLRNHLSAFSGCFVKSLEIKPLLSTSKHLLDEYFEHEAIRGAIRRNSASISMLQQLQKIPVVGFISSRLGTQLPFEIEVDEDLACFAGLWLADGCYDKNSVIISVVEPEARATIERVANRFRLQTKMHSDGISLMINSKPFKQFLENVLELRGNAYTKKMAPWMFNLEKPLAAAVLRGYFSGDGWVRKNDIAIRSSSEQLLKDTQTLLLRFGIPLRIKWNRMKDKTFEARVSGAKFLREFIVSIGFVIDKKTAKAAKWRNAPNRDVSDVIPLPKPFYAPIKKALKNEVGITRSYKGWKSYKYSQYDIGRDRLQQITEKYPDQIPAELHELAFNDIFWDPVEKIERRSFEGFVYDFSVAENESFIAGNVVCHNTRELQLPGFLHWVPMTTRESNQEGKGGVTMNDLLVNALRMRPDRIIVGEIRRQRDAEVMFEAMHTGHSVYTTLHANTAEETIRRMTNPPIAIPATMLDSVHMNVVMFRNRRLGVRRALELAEFVPEKRREGEEIIKANVLYRWRGVDDTIVPHGQSIRLMDELELHTGLTKSEIDEDLKQKQRILEWLVQHNIHDINEIGVIMAEYYSDATKVYDMVEKNIKPDLQIPEEYKTKVSH